MHTFTLSVLFAMGTFTGWCGAAGECSHGKQNAEGERVHVEYSLPSGGC